MGPTWGPPGPLDPRWAPCWPHETCYRGGQIDMPMVKSSLCKHVSGGLDHMNKYWSLPNQRPCFFFSAWILKIPSTPKYKKCIATAVCLTQTMLKLRLPTVILSQSLHRYVHENCRFAWNGCFYEKGTWSLNTFKWEVDIHKQLRLLFKVGCSHLNQNCLTKLPLKLRQGSVTTCHSWTWIW